MVTYMKEVANVCVASLSWRHAVFPHQFLTVDSSVGNSLLMNETFFLSPTRMWLEPDGLLGASFRPSSRRRSQRALTSTLAPSVTIVKRSRPSLRRSAKTCSMCLTNLSSQKPSRASLRSFTTRCMSNRSAKDGLNSAHVFNHLLNGANRPLSLQEGRLPSLPGRVCIWRKA